MERLPVPVSLSAASPAAAATPPPLILLVRLTVRPAAVHLGARRRGMEPFLVSRPRPAPAPVPVPLPPAPSPALAMLPALALEFPVPQVVRGEVRPGGDLAGRAELGAGPVVELGLAHPSGHLRDLGVAIDIALGALHHHP